MEHMMFMGSEEFPNVEDFPGFVYKHAGEYDAYTSHSDTTYGLKVEPGSLRLAVRRLSAMLKAPLFMEAALEKEVCNSPVDPQQPILRYKCSCNRSLDAPQDLRGQNPQGLSLRKFMRTD